MSYESTFNPEAVAVDPMITAAWKTSRLGRFTSSQINKLNVKGTGGKFFGQAAETYIYKKAGEVITQEANEVSSAAIKWGEEHEADGIAMFEKLKGEIVNYYGKANPVFFEFGEHAGGSPDGIIELKRKVVEMKCPFESGYHTEVFHLVKKGTFDLKKYDAEYYGQCQANMWFTKMDSAVFVSYDPRVVDYRFAIAAADIPRDEEYIKNLEVRLTEAIKVKIEYLTDMGYFED